MAFTTSSPDWLQTYVKPFVSLSYPIATPAHPDSFPNSSYYRNGPLDLCLVVALIAVMAVLRDVLRINIFEPFARWKLTRDAQWTKDNKANIAANGNGNGNGHATVLYEKLTLKERKKLEHAVTRFAEQGWQFTYAFVAWAYGFVSLSRSSILD